MGDHPRRRVTGDDRVGQRVGDQFGAQVIGKREPDHTSGGDVDDGDRYSLPSSVGISVSSPYHRW
jgi:hypothetical protein